MAAGENDSLTLRQISPDDRVSGLSLGDKSFVPLQMFLKKDARRHHQENLSKTYVFADAANKVVGYITLVCSQIELDKPPEGIDGYTYARFPAVKIAKLAVDTSRRGQDLGFQLVSLAIAVSKERVLPNVGCRFLAVDSHPLAISFYEKCGFRLLDTETNKAGKNPLMFLDLGKLN